MLFSDSSGTMAAEATVAATNFWNPVGWIAGGVLVAEAVIVAAIASDRLSENSSATDDEYERAKNNGEVAPNNRKVRQEFFVKVMVKEILSGSIIPFFKSIVC